MSAGKIAASRVVRRARDERTLIDHARRASVRDVGSTVPAIRRATPHPRVLRVPRPAAPRSPRSLTSNSTTSPLNPYSSAASTPMLDDPHPTSTSAAAPAALALAAAPQKPIRDLEARLRRRVPLARELRRRIVHPVPVRGVRARRRPLGGRRRRVATFPTASETTPSRDVRVAARAPASSHARPRPHAHRRALARARARPESPRARADPVANRPARVPGVPTSSRDVVVPASLRRASRSRRDSAMPRSARKESFYAVARGRARGVYTTWDDAKKQVQNFGGAMHKVRRHRTTTARATRDAPSRRRERAGTNFSRSNSRAQKFATLDEARGVPGGASGGRRDRRRRNGSKRSRRRATTTEFATATRRRARDRRAKTARGMEKKVSARKRGTSGGRGMSTRAGEGRGGRDRGARASARERGERAEGGSERG